jgi:hypothetical protein
MRQARGDAGLGDEARFVEGRDGGGVLRQAWSLELLGRSKQKERVPGGPHSQISITRE